MCSASDMCSERHENDMAESPGEGKESVKESAIGGQNGMKKGHMWILLK